MIILIDAEKCLVKNPIFNHGENFRQTRNRVELPLLDKEQLPKKKKYFAA